MDNYCKENKLRFTIDFKDENTIIEIFGKSSHGGSPWNGVNAATHLMNFVANNFDSKLFTHFTLLLDYHGSGLNIKYHEEIVDVSVNTGIAIILMKIFICFKYQVSMLC